MKRDNDVNDVNITSSGEKKYKITMAILAVMVLLDVLMLVLKFWHGLPVTLFLTVVSGVAFYYALKDRGLG